MYATYSHANFVPEAVTVDKNGNLVLYFSKEEN